MNTKERLLALILKMFDAEVVQAIDHDAPLTSDHLDSLSVAELLFAVEDEFRVNLSTGIDQGTTLNQLVAILDSQMSQDVPEGSR